MAKRPRSSARPRASAKRPARNRAKPAPDSRSRANEPKRRGGAPRLPLDGIRVVEFSHMVMGPTCGMILGDLGAEVIKVEPPGGDKTRRLIGSGAGFFALFNRNKKSVTADLSDRQDRARIEKLIASADIVSENFRAGALAKYGFDYASLKKTHKRLIYVSHKGFLPGPYDHRVALDEVVQMMAGLAYMTGPPGRPLRAGSSVNDIMGGMFGVIGALAALAERDRTGRGQEVQVGLFENCVLLSAQHMLQYRLTGVASPPMPDRINAWGVFDLFDTADGEQVFLGVVTDTQWAVFGRAFDLGGLADDPRLASNNLRVEARAWMLPALREIVKRYSSKDLQAVFEREGLPYAPIVRPEQLFDDPHLLASGGLANLTMENGATLPVPPLPILLDGRHLKPRMPLPRIGEHNAELARAAKPRKRR
ncbi:MAG: CoA transferase [Alphaproteobacteria bacterium]|nr:MAG: CoA transferase [Alphaproteobacteria bacterium]